MSGCDRSADDIVDRLTRAWTTDELPNLRATQVEEFEPDIVQDTDAVLLIARHDTEQMQILPLLAMLEEAGVPVVALLDGPAGRNSAFEYGGALVQSLDGDDRVLCATLLGLLFRQRAVVQLRQDVALARRFQGGLKGEIARMQEELQLAAMVQREFLPRELPSLYGVSFASLWRPSNFVSGDIFDIMRLDEDHIGIFLADAVGHGVPAALMTMVICRSLATKDVAEASYRVLPPEEVLERLNTDMIRRQGRSTRFATAVYGVINCRSRMLQIAGAGHPAPIILRANGGIEEIDTCGGLLGVFADETFEQRSVELGVNDRLLLYSDGFEQAFPRADADPYERRLPTTRYREEFEQMAGIYNAQAIIDTISHRLNDQSGSLHQIDDLTLLCMHAGPLAIGASRSVARQASAPSSTVHPDPSGA